jgi:alginate O-acetyltransferase complex protein AlgJ
MLQRLVRAIKQSGARLVIVPVPDKADQVEDRLCGIRATQSRLRDQFWNELARVDGVLVVDLRNHWPKPGYWKTDTHWDQTGARFAAEQIALAVAGTLDPRQDAIKLVDGSMRQRTGDLARLSGLTDAPHLLAPGPEQEREIKVDVSRSGGLLDDTPEPQIILAGSSFSLNSGFLEYLETSLSREVAQVSQPGGGFAGALIETLDKRAGSLEKVKAVIWEWPMRSLVSSPSEAEKNFMRQIK